jgi:4-diphosphocytidyl-2-C-methyl-D-erythritol kinase
MLCIQDGRENIVKEINLKAFAKINLGLDVVGVRPDGYHLVKMVMETINLYDRVKIRVSPQSEIRVKSNLGYLPTDGKNIAYQAARLLLDEFGIRQGVDIQLDKHIPVAAGLAGGSSNAAAVLKGVNRLFELGLSKEDLMVRGLKLGADVPYCIKGGCAMATGIGEELTPLPSLPKCNILLLKLPFSISTKVIYQELDKLEITNPPNIDELIKGLEERSLRKVAESLGNVLELVSIPKHPKIQMSKEELLKQGAIGSLMSGSGPTVFGLFEDRDRAVFAKKKIEKLPFRKQMYLV